MRQHVLQNVGTHLQRLLVGGLRVVVYARVLPSVAKVALVGEQAHQPSLPYQPEGLRRLSVVLVNLRQTVGEGYF